MDNIGFVLHIWAYNFYRGVTGGCWRCWAIVYDTLGLALGLTARGLANFQCPGSALLPEF